MNRFPIFLFREPLNIQRAESGEKIFRQTQQKSARRVHPLRRFFVKYDGKDSVDSSCDEFLEVPFSKFSIETPAGYVLWFMFVVSQNSILVKTIKSQNFDEKNHKILFSEISVAATEIQRVESFAHDLAREILAFQKKLSKNPPKLLTGSMICAIITVL